MTLDDPMDFMLPIIASLASCQTDADRADWLSAVPFDTFCREKKNIRTIIELSDFTAGLAHVDALIVLTAARRLPDGTLPQHLISNFEITRIEMQKVARRLAA